MVVPSQDVGVGRRRGFSQGIENGCVGLAGLVALDVGAFGKVSIQLGQARSGVQVTYG